MKGYCFHDLRNGNISNQLMHQIESGSPVRMLNIPVITCNYSVQPSQLLQDFVHQQYFPKDGF